MSEVPLSSAEAAALQIADEQDGFVAIGHWIAIAERLAARGLLRRESDGQYYREKGAGRFVLTEPGRAALDQVEEDEFFQMFGGKQIEGKPE